MNRTHRTYTGHTENSKVCPRQTRINMAFASTGHTGHTLYNIPVRAREERNSEKKLGARVREYGFRCVRYVHNNNYMNLLDRKAKNRTHGGCVFRVSGVSG